MLILAIFAILTQPAEPSAHPAPTDAAAAAESAPAPLEESAEGKWEFSASVMVFIVPDDQDCVQPTFTADRDWLHLEGRYNYEALDTASLWLGFNLSGGEAFTWQVTPMIGAVFGETNGIAPGYEATLGWWRLELYSEGEYVFDTDESSDSYFYNWSELTLSPLDWFRFGLVTQRTRLYESDRDVQYGFLAGLSFEHVDLAAYILNLDEEEPVIAFSFELTF